MDRFSMLSLCPTIPRVLEPRPLTFVAQDQLKVQEERPLYVISRGLCIAARGAVRCGPIARGEVLDGGSGGGTEMITYSWKEESKEPSPSTCAAANETTRGCRPPTAVPVRQTSTTIRIAPAVHSVTPASASVSFFLGSLSSSSSSSSSPSAVVPVPVVGGHTGTEGRQVRGCCDACAIPR